MWSLFELLLPVAVRGVEADPVTKTTVLEAIVDLDVTSAWWSMVGGTRDRIIGRFFAAGRLERVFGGGEIPTLLHFLFTCGSRCSRKRRSFYADAEDMLAKVPGKMRSSSPYLSLLHGRHGA